MDALWIERESASRHGTAVTAFLLVGGAPRVCGRGGRAVARLPVDPTGRRRHVLGVEGNTLFWCGPRGRLRSSRLAALSAPVSRSPVPSAANDLNRLDQARMQAWVEQAVGVRIKRRARLVGHLDDAALAREIRVSAAGVRCEGRRRRSRYGRPRPRRGVLRAAAERERAARAGAAAKRSSNSPAA